MEPLLSIILPVYNQEKYLNKSLKSVIEQTYKNLEIIVVNDGSNDGSLEIIKRFQSTDSRIKIVNKENGGLVDATLCGIRNSTGSIIAFLDPDDYIGKNFLNNLYLKMGDCDIVSAGFFYDNKGNLTPYCLNRDYTFVGNELDELTNSYLFNSNESGISHNIFFSRWNKIYSRECVMKAVRYFDSCRDVTLGEDSIFTYLVLKNANKVKTLSFPNSYYYNVGNSNSMMKSGAIDTHIQKSIIAFNRMKNMLEIYGDSMDTAHVLYYYLIESIFNRVLVDKNAFKELYSKIRVNKIYQESILFFINNTSSKNTKLKLKIRRLVSSNQYRFIFYTFLAFIKKEKNVLGDISFWIKETRKKGCIVASQSLKYRRNRKNAFTDLNDKLPMLEKRILPIITPYFEKQTDFEKSSIEKNIFIFWWDGFDKAPDIVRGCEKSVRKYYSDCNIVNIDKNNYEKYTDINPIIKEDFIKGKISIQTFSDILRFNLLKNNGGLWVDSTILFLNRMDIFENLSYKSIESLIFSSTESFLEYEGLKCSWSGYFMASRKNSVLVSVMNEIFERYYIKYKTYSIYFFIDAALMICKKYKIDAGALDNIQRTDKSMFVLSKLLYNNYSDEVINDLEITPQKLSWFSKTERTENSFYEKIFG